MRHAAAHNHGVQHAFALEIVDERAGPLEKSKILGPMNGRPISAVMFIELSSSQRAQSLER